MFIKHGLSLLKKPHFFSMASSAAHSISSCKHLHFLCLCRRAAEDWAKSRLQITALQLRDHMETMIADLSSIYSTGPLLSGWTYAPAWTSQPLNAKYHGQIIPCKHDTWHWCRQRSVHFVFFFAQETEKNENRLMQLWIMRTLLFVCQRSRRQLARGYNVPLNSHYEFKSNLHHMDLQIHS